LHRWVVNRHEPILHFIFYTGPKALLIMLGIFCVLIGLLSLKDPLYKIYRRNCLLLCLSLILVPLAISGLKKATHVYTPEKTIRYGGKVPYIKVLEKYPADVKPQKPGRGWPAGHASGGFSLMMLYFIFNKRSNKILGLLLGLAAGWTMGLYQTLNGQHYLSHSIVSMQISWIIILLIYTGVHRMDLFAQIPEPVDIQTALLETSSKNRM
ncbi:phosphatase PAP2 family protein, partial [bacterium]|nr:phosphatase PAP2 family protein [candidate division CSSED10-310 bacterium]